MVNFIARKVSSQFSFHVNSGMRAAPAAPAVASEDESEEGAGVVGMLPDNTFISKESFNKVYYTAWSLLAIFF